MIRFIIFLLFIASVYSESKPKWFEEKITETCSYSLKNGTNLEMSKTMDELCSIYKLMNVTIASERNLIMNCLLDDQWNNSDYICEKWWIEPNHTTTEVITENELGLYQFAKLVKIAINQSEKCLYELSHNNSETCEFLTKFNDTILFSFQRIIYQKLFERDLLDQRVVDHCFLYHQFDEFHECLGVSNGTHLNGFTMSKARQTRISFLWKLYQDNMFRCMKHFDDRNCIEKFDIKKVCKYSSNQDCIQVMMCKYTSSWKTMPDHICYFISRTNKFIPKTVCTKEKKGCIQVIFCKYTDSLQTTQGHICQMNTNDETYISPRITKMQQDFDILENNHNLEDCYNFHQGTDDGICEKVKTLSLEIDFCPYSQNKELNHKKRDILSETCVLFNLMNTTDPYERVLIMVCLIEDEYLNSDYICDKWWNKAPNLKNNNISEKEIGYYQFATIAKSITKQAEQCLYGLVDKESESCQSFNNYGQTTLTIFQRTIYKRLFQRDVEDQKFVEHCFIHHQLYGYDKCVGVSDGTHIKGFTMSNERRNRIIGLWNNMNQCLKHFDNKTCLARLDPTNACADGTKEQCIQVMNCKYSRSWHSDPLDLCHVIIGSKIINKSLHHPEVSNLIHNFVIWHDNEDIEDCINFHKDVDDGICKKVISKETIKILQGRLRSISNIGYFLSTNIVDLVHHKIL
ncbi:hypothetical protein RDWZM_006056 [Blomia tropicalis]|uniref:Uncharacterized protein n=1 Tax=Blomia tropicalis TaxID=40697 RepID=A0A9Q0M7C7_BLOTA|nr:hypothetical protein RDWZM_006056 [Blomia tropicalis]